MQLYDAMPKMFTPGTCQHCFDQRFLHTYSAATDMPLGRNSIIYIYKTTCKATAPADRQILSTGKPKVANTQIVMGQHPGQSHQRRYYVQPAVNCQPSYCWGTRRASSTDIKNLKSDMVVFLGDALGKTGSGPSAWMRTPLCM